jgi:hypothetical protein
VHLSKPSRSEVLLIAHHYVGNESQEFCISAKNFVSDGEGRVKGINTIRVEWTKDASGQWRMKEVPGSEQVRRHVSSMYVCRVLTGLWSSSSLPTWSCWHLDSLDPRALLSRLSAWSKTVEATSRLPLANIPLASMVSMPAVIAAEDSP